MNGGLLVIFCLVVMFLSKLFIAFWVYNDGRTRGDDSILWPGLILFFSASFSFLLYFLVVRNESKIRCDNCNYLQSDKLHYCGRCGEDMLILSDRAYVEEGQDANKKYLVIGLLLMGLGILSGLIYTFKFIWALK